MLRRMTSASQPPVAPEFVEPLAPAEPAAPAAPEPVPAPAAQPAPHVEPAAEREPEAPAYEFEAEPDWEHERAAFHGDLIGYRVPTQAAFAALGVGAGPGATQYEQAFYTRYFLSQHLSAESFRRINMRSMQPEGYPAEVADPQSELIDLISKPLMDRLTAEAEAARKAAKPRR